MGRAGHVAAAAALLLAAAGAAADLVRVTCTGVQRLSLDGEDRSCAQSSVLTDPDGGLLSGFTRARASLGPARLAAAAAGGAIRDAGYNGGEASALLKETVHLEGIGESPAEITVSMRIAYHFRGLGLAELDAILSTAAGDDPLGDSRVRVRLRHTGLGGAALARTESRGRFRNPAQGAHAPAAELEISVTQTVGPDRPRMDLRAYLTARSMPNLGGLETTVSGWAIGDATFTVAAPCGVTARAAGAALARARPCPGALRR